MSFQEKLFYLICVIRPTHFNSWGRNEDTTSMIMPATSTAMVFCEQPFHSFSIIPHTLLKVTLRAISMHHENVSSNGRIGQESLAKAKTEELAVPQQSGKGAENDVVKIKACLRIVAPCAVLAVLVETVYRIGDKAAQRNEERCGQRAEHRVGGVAEVEMLAKAETYAEACAHKSSKQRNDDALGEVEVLNGLLLFFVTERLRLHVASHANNANTYQRYHHAYDNGHRKVLCVAGKYGGEYGSESGACARAMLCPRATPR